MNDKIPRRIAWFAPWTWKRTTLQLIVFAIGAATGLAWVIALNLIYD